MPPAIKTLGIIAGSRTLPLLIAEEARRTGICSITAVAFEGETDPELARRVDKIVWLRVGQLSRMIAAFQEAGVSQCVMAGQIAPGNLFEVRPDFRALMMLFKLKEKNAHTIFGAIAEELAREGITLIEATPWLGQVMPGKDFHLGPRLTRGQREDVHFGFRIAKETSRLEIGQTVVVKEGVVLAVEAFEGTDQCLLRAGELAGRKGGGVAVKVARHEHDMRFDIPCIGARTIETCQRARIAVLAIESNRTVLLERAEVEKLVRNNGPSIVTVSESRDSR